MSVHLPQTDREFSKANGRLVQFSVLIQRTNCPSKFLGWHWHQKSIFVQNANMFSSKVEDDNILMLLLVLQQSTQSLEEVNGTMESLLMQHVKDQRRLNRSLPMEKKRLTWAQFADKLTPTHFRRMFRMTEASFKVLCTYMQ
jgi:hypothetical protein